MIRPEFLTRPYDWTRASRTGQTRTDYACAVSHNVKPRSSWHPAEVIVVIGFVLFLLVAFA